MEPEHQAAYDKLKGQLRIDTLRLTDELMELPQYQADVAEWTADAQRRRDDAKDALDIAKAEVSATMREAGGAKPPSEARISSELLIDEYVQGAMNALRDAEFELALWKGVAESARAKNGALRAISDLIQSGYASPQSLLSERKRDMARVRRENA